MAPSPRRTVPDEIHARSARRRSRCDRCAVRRRRAGPTRRTGRHHGAQAGGGGAARLGGPVPAPLRDGPRRHPDPRRHDGDDRGREPVPGQAAGLLARDNRRQSAGGTQLLQGLRVERAQLRGTAAGRIRAVRGHPAEDQRRAADRRGVRQQHLRGGRPAGHSVQHPRRVRPQAGRGGAAGERGEIPLPVRQLSRGKVPHLAVRRGLDEQGILRHAGLFQRGTPGQDLGRDDSSRGRRDDATGGGCAPCR
jgi:hypothetical protein